MNASQTAARIDEAIDGCVQVLGRTQSEAGSWKGDYSGPMFLPGMYVGTCYATGTHLFGPEPDLDTRAAFIRYLRGAQNPDGGYGLGLENTSCVFTTVLSYVGLRLLGLPADDPTCARARGYFQARGGALGCASWGRFFLSVLNLHDWEGCHPVTPETWLLPEWLPVHPGRMWCHSRMVYLPMAWLYGRRSQVPLDESLRALRAEIYNEPYDQIRWRRSRRCVHATDAYVPHAPVLRAALAGLNAWERVVPRRLRERALERILDVVRHEDEITSYVCIGPVNKLYNTLCWHFAEPGGDRVRRHAARLPEYLHVDGRGARMNGYNSSELWDTAFALHALHAADGAETDVARRAFGYLDRTQVRQDPSDRARYYRDPSRGGWPFSTLEHGWPITDCTAEGLRAAIEMADHVPEPLSDDRLRDAAELILWWQNPDGGWATYERTRGPGWLERFNPSDIFGDIMIDYSYTECTSACVQALIAFDRRFSGALPAIPAALRQAERFLRDRQEPGGGWFGSWGVCYTYGTWFAVETLRALGVGKDDPALRAAVAFLERHQLADGGWGESIASCREVRYVSTDEGQAVMTAWAVLSLIAAGEGASDAARRGVEFLLGRQRPDGEFPPEHIAGVFNRTCSIHYDAYLKIFPLWALAAARRGLGRA
jgi:squalene/oxidosqualene cyclase-like protein